MQGDIKASARCALLAIWLGLWFPPVWLAFRCKKTKLRDRMRGYYMRGMLKILGIRLTVNGTISDKRPLLLVANHLSYIDIALMEACHPLCYTPKSEIAGWPVLGSIARICGAVFVDRRPEKVLEMRRDIEQVLAQGRVICLFPEATTGNGIHLKPFRSGFFSMAEQTIEGQELTVQPVAISYTHISGLPIGTSQWSSIAWYGDMDLAPHAWELLKMGPIRAEVSFLPPVSIAGEKNRKQIATHCRTIIEETLIAVRQRSNELQPHKKSSFHPKQLRVKSDN